MPHDGKVAVVTGANRGMGLEACRQLAARGYRVVLTSRDGAQGEAAARALADRGLSVVSSMAPIPAISRGSRPCSPLALEAQTS